MDRAISSARTFELKTCFFMIDNEIMETAPMKLYSILYARKFKIYATQVCKYKRLTNLNDAVIIHIAAIASNTPSCIMQKFESKQLTS